MSEQIKERVRIALRRYDEAHDQLREAVQAAFADMDALAYPPPKDPEPVAECSACRNILTRDGYCLSCETSKFA